MTEGQIHLESRGIAVPVLGPHGVVYAAIGVVVANDGTSPQPAIELLTMAAAGITRALEEAYLPDGAAPDGTHGMRALVSSSQRSLDYFASLDAERAPSKTGGAR